MPQVTHTGVTLTADDLRKIEPVIDRLDHNDQEGALDEFQNLADYIVGEYRKANSAESGAQWIPVSERLPDDCDDVLVLYRYEDIPARAWDVGESFYDATHEHNAGWCFGSCDYAHVTHWMPKDALLPAAPEPSP